MGTRDGTHVAICKASALSPVLSLWPLAGFMQQQLEDEDGEEVPKALVKASRNPGWKCLLTMALTCTGLARAKVRSATLCLKAQAG